MTMRLFSLLFAASCVVLIADCEEPTIVALGRTAALKQKFDDDITYCDWTLANDMSLDSDAEQNIARFKATFSEKEKICTLTINDTILDDSGTYKCHGKSIELIVYVTPKDPFLQYDDGTVVKNQKNELKGRNSVNLTCVSPNGYPAPQEMIWTVNKNIVPTDEPDFPNEKKAANATSRLLLTFATSYTIASPDNEKTVTCTVKHVSGPPKSVTRSFRNYYNTTKVELKATKTSQDGVAVWKLDCDADGNPHPTKFQIMNVTSGQSQLIVESKTHIIKVDGKYQCQAWTSRKEWMDSKVVEIEKNEVVDKDDGGNTASGVSSNVWLALFVTIASVLSLSGHQRTVL